MTIGRRSSKQTELWVASQKLKSPGHPLCQALNRLLHQAHFDTEVELLCRSYFKDDGRPSTPPGAYFRMLMVGFFENIDSQRGIAWRCVDSPSFKDFLGLAVDEQVPDHSNLTRMRQRLPFEVHEEVFEMILGIAKYDFARCAARDLGIIRSILAFGKPKVANESMRASCFALLAVLRVLLYGLVNQFEWSERLIDLILGVDARGIAPRSGTFATTC